MIKELFKLYVIFIYGNGNKMFYRLRLSRLLL